MGLRDQLLRDGYLPIEFPPSFGTAALADFFEANKPKQYFSKPSDRVRASIYSGSKRGMTRRAFSVVHPTTAYDLGRFCELHQSNIDALFAKSKFSLSVPRYEPPGSNRAVTIASHGELDERLFSRLSQFRFIARTDISRFYHSIYTHSIPWAMHGKAQAKADRKFDSASTWCNRLDQIIRCGQDGQTIGIPVGPDSSRIVAEVISTAIDLDFKKRCGATRFDMVRHVDDVWIGAHSYSDAENVLWRYREALREFELDVNENKTRIQSSDFRFAEAWPGAITSRLKFADDTQSSRRRERFRAALEHAFSVGVSTGDEGILKYAIRAVDSSDLSLTEWETFEPFLKRCAAHFGHTIDFVGKVLVWRRLIHQDIDLDAWTAILSEIIDRHGRLGNDSEVCWALYICQRLQIKISNAAADHVGNNCGAFSLIALLSCAEDGLVSSALFKVVEDRLKQEDANGPFWPVLLEWVSREWPNYSSVAGQMGAPVIKTMAQAKVSLYDADALPPVFQDVDAGDFGLIKSAIENSGAYDDDDDKIHVGF